MDQAEARRDRALQLLEEMRLAIIRHDMDGDFPPGRRPPGPVFNLDDLCETLHGDVVELRTEISGQPWVGRLTALCDRVEAINEDLRVHRSFTPDEREQLPRIERELLETISAAEHELRDPAQ